MSADQNEFDIFISYAHSDDVGEIVAGLRDQLEADFQHLLQRRIEIFRDRDDILDFHDWKVRCHHALRASQFFIVLLSPAYLASDACRWEWVEWLKRERERGQDGVGAACLWFIEIARLDAPADAERLRQWKHDFGQRFNVAFHEWSKGGREALLDSAAKTELEKLTHHVAQHLRLLAQVRGQRGNLGWPQDRFVGREPELLRLREHLLDAAPSAPVALIGIGGIGKTALALTFAFREADAFPGGRWLLRCEGHARLDAAMRPLVQDLGIELTEREKLDDTLAARRVLTVLRERGPALFLLDNVDTPALLAPDSLTLLSGESSIRLLATTRSAPGAFATAGATIKEINLDQLPEDQALDLIRLHQHEATFASTTDEKDAREIVRALGGLTLAVETAAVYLGQNDPRVVAEPRYAVRIADYLEKLRLDLTSSGEVEDGVRPGDAIKQLREVAATIRPTLARLDAPALTVLQIAVLLPADSIPLPWLREVAGKFHPSLAKVADIAERDEWTDLISALIGMRLLRQKDETPVLTIHRLLQRVLDTELHEQRVGLAASLESYIDARAEHISHSSAPPAPWELDSLVVTLPHVLARHPTRELTASAGDLSEKVKTHRGLPAASALMATVYDVFEKEAAANPLDLNLQHDVSIGLGKRGELLVAQGDLAGALHCFTQSKNIVERLAASDLACAKWQRDIAVTLGKLGDIAVAQGDLAAARRFFTQSKDVAERLATCDPTNARWQFDISVPLAELGNLAVAQGDLGEALRYFTHGKTIVERLAASDPTNVVLQRGLSMSLERLGNLAVGQGDLVGALRCFTQCKGIRKRLAASDPANTEWQRDLSVLLNYLGNVAMAQGNLDEAKRYYTECKTISERLATSDPTNTEWQRDLSVSLEKLGTLAMDQADLAGALRCFTEAKFIAERLADSDPTNATWQRDLSVSLEKLGFIEVEQSNLTAALRSFAQSKTIAERLAASDPSNAAWQRDLVAAHQRLAEVAAKAGDTRASARHMAQCHSTLMGMLTMDMHLDSDLASFLGQLEESAPQNYARQIAASTNS